ncbi:MAG: DUF2505 family protein, partial [Bradymonadaceae bacterium]
ILATPQSILDYLLSDTYIEDLLPHLDAVSNIDEFEVARRGDTIEQRMRYEAPTKLPGFLKRYEAKMPELVHWEERGVWNTHTFEMTLEIVPDAPESWNDRWDQAGSLRLVERDGGTELIQVLNFNIHAFGLGKFVERALGPEIEDIFETRADVVRKHFL